MSRSAAEPTIARSDRGWTPHWRCGTTSPRSISVVLTAVPACGLAVACISIVQEPCSATTGNVALRAFLTPAWPARATHVAQTRLNSIIPSKFRGQKRQALHAIGGENRRGPVKSLNLKQLDLAERAGIRTNQHPSDSVTYRFHNATVAANARIAVAHCPLLPAPRSLIVPTIAIRGVR